MNKTVQSMLRDGDGATKRRREVEQKQRLKDKMSAYRNMLNNGEDVDFDE